MQASILHPEFRLTNKAFNDRFAQQFNANFDEVLFQDARTVVSDIHDHVSTSDIPHSLLEELNASGCINSCQRRSVACLIGPLSEHEQNLRAMDYKQRQSEPPPSRPRRIVTRREGRRLRLRDDMREEKRLADAKDKAARAEKAELRLALRRGLVSLYISLVHPGILALPH